MKNYGIKIILFIVIGIFSQTLVAQKVYVKLNAGYNFANGNQFEPFTDSRSIRNSDGDRTSTESVVKAASLGKGFDFGITAGYKFHENMSIELGLSYLVGGKINTESYTKELGYYGGDNSEHIYERKAEFKANMLKINPSICLNLGADKIDPYIKVGVLLGIGKINYNLARTSSNVEDSQDFSYNSTSNSISKYEFNGSFAFGYNAGIGVVYKLDDHLSLFGEVNFVSMRYSPSKGKITKMEQNGVDQLSDMTTYETEVDFVEEITSNSSSVHDEDQADKSLKVSFPFSSVGLNVGIIYAF